MADAKSIITLNIGSQRVSMGVFEPSAKGALILKKYGVTSILADPAAETARLPQIRVAVGELAQKLGVPKGHVHYSISGQSVFTRFVKLPPIEEDSVEQLVAFEAQQHVPFPIDEVVWDWQMLPGSEGDKEVVLVAIKGDALNEINDTVIEAGLHTKDVDTSPMALFNALRHNYPETDETTLLIDIGARTTNLIYMQGDRFFTRSVAAVSGSAVTTAIAKEYHIPFSEAETQKISNGLVALGSGHTSQMEEPVAALAMTIRGALSKLPAEISRTTNFYRSQHGGSAPQRVLLAGAGANLPFTKDFIEERLSLPVEFFNPLRKVSVGKGADVDLVSRDAHTMGELVGLALRDLGKESTPVRVDLVPDVVQTERENERRKPFLLGASALALLGALLWTGAQCVRAKTATVENDKVEQEADKLSGPEGQLRRIKGESGATALLGTGYADIVLSRGHWLAIVDELNQKLSHKSVWITDFDPVAGYDPLDPGAAAGKGVQSVADARFSKNTTYGGSSLARLRELEIKDPKRPKAPAKKVMPLVNAVRVQGFWAANPSNDGIVYELLKNLWQKNERSHFSFAKPGGEEGEELTDAQVITSINTTIPEGVYAAPFTLIIPLREPLPAPK